VKVPLRICSCNLASLTSRSLTAPPPTPAGKREKITITNDKGRLSQEEIDRMVAEAEEFAEQDKAVKGKIDARNKLETYCYNMKTTMSEKLGDKLEDDDKETVSTPFHLQKPPLGQPMRGKARCGEAGQRTSIERGTLWDSMLGVESERPGGGGGIAGAVRETAVEEVYQGVADRAPLNFSRVLLCCAKTTSGGVTAKDGIRFDDIFPHRSRARSRRPLSG